MKEIKKAEAEKAQNYSAEQEAAIVAAAPLNLEKAKALADEFGKSWRSVVAKAVNLGLEYQAKEKPAKRPAKVTKAELVSAIENATGTDSPLRGLEKATMQSLVTLLGAVSDADTIAAD